MSTARPSIQHRATGPGPWGRRRSARSEVGQTAIVAVLAITIALSLVGAVLIQMVVNSDPLQQTKAVEIYANRAMEAGQNAYLAAVNANAAFAQCSSSHNSLGTCSGLKYGYWTQVQGSGTDGSDPEYYAFGNPFPQFDPTTHALTSLTVQVLGAAYDASATNHYLFDQETMNIAPSNGFLKNVWWSNFESYSSTGDYSNCQYNWNTNYNISGAGLDCGPVYFGPGDYLFGPIYTNDSVFISGDGTAAGSPAFGTTASPSAVTTADPHCLFVNSTYGMNGSDTNCANVNTDVPTYNTTSSSYGNTVEAPPSSNSQLGVIAAQDGCVYAGPTQITLSGTQMTVTSPDTPSPNTLLNSTNTNSCPTNGATGSLPDNGVVYVQNATTAQTQAWANPFDDPVFNTVTNLTLSPTAPAGGATVTLTAKVTSGSNQLNSGNATVAFSQAKCNSYSGGTCKGHAASATISACTAQSNWTAPVAVTPATNPPTYTSSATCTATEGTYAGDTFSAVYSGGTYTTTSSANSGQTYTLTSTESYGPDAQVTAGGCTSCYYGQTSNPNSEGDAFVSDASSSSGLSGQLTIGTANNIIIDGNLQYADCQWTTGQSGLSSPSQGFCPYNTTATNDALGLIANNYVEVNRPVVQTTTGGFGGGTTTSVLPACGASGGVLCDPSSGTGLTIDAAVLALTQSFVVDNYGVTNTEGNLYVYGSIQQYARGPVGTFNNGALATGYDKHYTWDPLLDYVAPPSYLVPSTPSWTLSSTNNTAGNWATNVCPPIYNTYSGTTAPTYIASSSYCTQTTGGLPHYPSITVPDSPYNVSAAYAGGTVTVTWSDPPSNNGSTITGYTVIPSPACSACTYSNLTGSGVTSATVTGLTVGTYYSFTVTATNSVGTSSPSDPPSNSVVVPTAPPAPTNATAVANSTGTVTVSWTDPPNNGSAITGYTVTPSPACGSCTYTTLSGPSVTSTTITGLTIGSSYTFTVKATNGIGTSPASSATNAVTPAKPPGAPTIGTATRGNGAAIVSWTAPGVTNGSAVQGYVVTPYVGGVAQTALAQTYASTALTETVSGLANGTAYTFVVAAYNGVGTGSNSAQSNSVTPATVPGAPTGVSASVNTTTGVVTVTWTDPGNGGSAITGYAITPSPACSGCTYSSLSGATVASGTVTGLTLGTSYTFSVTATNGVGTSSAGTSSSVLDATVPGFPTGVTGSTGTTAKTVNISWTAPASTGGSPITGYTVSAYNTITGTLVASVTVTATSNTNLAFNSPGLTSGTTYNFKVAATNAVGTGTQTAAVSIKAK